MTRKNSLNPKRPVRIKATAMDQHTVLPGTSQAMITGEQQTKANGELAFFADIGGVGACRSCLPELVQRHGDDTKSKGLEPAGKGQMSNRVDAVGE